MKSQRLPRPLSLGVRPRKTSCCEVEGSHEHRPQAAKEALSESNYILHPERARAYWANISAGRLKSTNAVR